MATSAVNRQPSEEDYINCWIVNNLDSITLNSKNVDR